MDFTSPECFCKHLVSLKLLDYDHEANPIGVFKDHFQNRGILTFEDYVFAVYSEWGNTTRFVIALAIVPITMTAAEAFSPHTCDTPFIFIVATALICFLFEAVDDDFDPFSPSFSQ